MEANLAKCTEFEVNLATVPVTVNCNSSELSGCYHTSNQLITNSSTKTEMNLGITPVP